MAINQLISDLPLVLDLDPATGRLFRVQDPKAQPLLLSDLDAALHPQDRPAFQQALSAALHQRAPRFQTEARLLRSGGRPVLVGVFGSAVAVPDGQPARYLLVLTDNSPQASQAELFELATAASSDVIFLLDFDSNQHWWSEAFTRRFGHQPLLGTDAVERWFDFVHPADKARVRLSHGAARSGGAKAWQDEYRFCKADGSYAHVIDRARFFRRPDGTVARSISTLTDVTELRDMTELFRQTAEAAQDVIYSHDPVTRTLWLNDAFHERYGHDPALYADAPDTWMDLIFPADRAGFLQACAAAVKSTATRLELHYRLAGRGGAWRLVIDRAQIMRDETGRARRIVGSIIDVTALRQEEERTRALVEIAANSVYDYDVASGTIRYSEGMEEAFGHRWIDPQPVVVKWLAQLHPDERPRVEAEFLGFLHGPDRYARLEYRFLRADGRWAWVRDRMVALRDAAGKPVRVIGGLEDVTDEHEAQERLHHSQKMEAIGRLTGGVAHDFNNLLTVIIGSAGLMEADAALAPEHRDLARNVGFAARRGAELTSGLLSFARQQPLAPVPLDMGAVFAEMDGLLRRILPAYITLDTVQTSGLWLVEADPTQLNAALLNLCVNAADSMAKGGRITLESRNWLIDAALSPADPDALPGEYLRIDITDTGHGMSPDVLARAFDPFFTTKPLGKGSGLGLSMVWGFAKQSGGHATICSAPDIGTTVTMFLPRSHKSLSHATATGPKEMAYGAGQHVLVVEDDPMLRRFVVAMVERLRYRVSQAENGDQALQILHACPDIALLFSDVVMPGQMSGKELAERAQRAFPGLRILFTSGYSENAFIHNGRLDEDVQFLAKPYQLRDLGDKLRSVLAGQPRRLHVAPSAAMTEDAARCC